MGERALRSLFVFIYLLAQICLSSRLPPVSELLSSVPLNCHACQKGVSTCMYAFWTHIRLSADKNLYFLLLKTGRPHLWPLRCIWCRPCGKTWPYLHVTHQKLDINGWGGTKIPCVLWSYVIGWLWCVVFFQLLKSALRFPGAFNQPKIVLHNSDVQPPLWRPFLRRYRLAAKG